MIRRARRARAHRRSPYVEARLAKLGPGRRRLLAPNRRGFDDSVVAVAALLPSSSPPMLPRLLLLLHPPGRRPKISLRSNHTPCVTSRRVASRRVASRRVASPDPRRPDNSIRRYSPLLIDYSTSRRSPALTCTCSNWLSRRARFANLCSRYPRISYTFSEILLLPRTLPTTFAIHT